jgi:Cd(II)/Pb(II)-responsive transcriptional regulator
MKIGELAAAAGCDVQTVRYYEREGLLAEPARETSGYRRYAQQHLERLQFIRHCRTLDISLAEIRRLLDYAEAPAESCPAVDALVEAHIARVRRQIESLTTLEGQLVALRRQCAERDGPHNCAIIESFMSAASQHACACHPA